MADHRRIYGRVVLRVARRARDLEAQAVTWETRDGGRLVIGDPLDPKASITPWIGGQWVARVGQKCADKPTVDEAKRWCEQQLGATP